MNYRGWKITYSESLPVTGRWRAERFGVGMCAADEAAIKRMVDQKAYDAENDRIERERQQR